MHICASAVLVITAFKPNYKDTAAAENKKRFEIVCLEERTHILISSVCNSITVSEKLPHHTINY